MAQVTIDLFFQTKEGFEGHIALVPGEGESGFTLLQNASKALQGAGCQPRLAKSYGGSGNKSTPPPTTCPECKGAVTVKDWTNPEGKAFKIHKCSKDEKHFKPIYKPVY